MQKILTMRTPYDDIRATADGWSAEDGDVAGRKVLLDAEVPVGLLRGYEYFFCHPTPLHAIASGWRLLAPPVKKGDVFEWWFEK